MPKHDDKVMLAEQVLEVRYVPSGSFLDVRGYVADYIRDSGFLPHWRIDTNSVNFQDKKDSVNKEGAFAGYRSAGYFVFDPETRNLFVDRAGSFWRILQKNQHYKLPSIERFGARTKVFLPSEQLFEDINHTMYEFLYTKEARETIGGTEKDVQFTVDLQEQDFRVRATGGPIHKGEATNYFSFKSKHFEKAGIFIDLDFYRTDQLKHEDVSRLLRSAIDLTWLKVEKLAAILGV